MAEKPVPPGGPPGGFTFDMGNNPGWTIDGVYDGDKSTQLATVSGPLTWDDLNQVSKPINGDPPGDNIGSARLMSSGGSTFTASSGYWRVDAISPDLADTSPFQNHTGVSFWVLNKFGGLGSVITQAIFQVEKCDGTTSYFREVNSSGVVFCTAAYNTWTHCVFNITVNNTNRIKRLYLRFFFQSGVPYEGLVNIDSITAQ